MHPAQRSPEDSNGSSNTSRSDFNLWSAGGPTVDARSAAEFDHWPDYLGPYGLSAGDVPELVRMSGDPELLDSGEDRAVYARVFAWRALGQLRAAAAVGPLIGLLKQIDEANDDWVGEELPDVFGMIGADAVEPLAAYLADAGNPEFARVAARGGLLKVAEQFLAERERVVGLIAAALGKFDADAPTVNGFLVSALLDLKAVEQLDVMRDAYRRGCVDETICGDYAAVEEELGLRPPRPPRVPVTRGQRDLLREAVNGAVPRLPGPS
jgi:hypothetical protein